MNQTVKKQKTILFLCPHHAAKSVMAEAYFNRAIQTAELTEFQAISAGTEPDEAAMPSVVELLWSENIDVAGHQPRRVTEDELQLAIRIISMGCSPEEMGVAPEEVEMWTDIPPASQDLMGARSAILAHIATLIEELQVSETK